MKKRDFLVAAASGAAAWPALAQGNAAKGLQGPALLTVTGVIGKGNRGPFDPVLDQMMAKQKLAFDRAHAFEFAMLAGMSSVTIQPTLEYDGKRHMLRGPLLVDVLKAAGAGEGGKLQMRAVDGYAPSISVAEARRLRFIVATHLDGRPMPLGGLGPLWAVYEADKVPEMAAKPVNERFALCPWGLYHIDVQA
jgi:hypothetical protein